MALAVVGSTASLRERLALLQPRVAAQYAGSWPLRFLDTRHVARLGRQ